MLKGPREDWDAETLSIYLKPEIILEELLSLRLGLSCTLGAGDRLQVWRVRGCSFGKAGLSAGVRARQRKGGLCPVRA